MWINELNTDQLIGLYIDSAGGGTHNLNAIIHPAYAFTGPYPTVGLKNYATTADVATAVEDFISLTGFPWLAAGDMSTIHDGNLLAVNYKNLRALPADNPGVGIQLNGFTSNGYTPYASYAAYKQAVLDLLGNVTL